MARCPRDVPRTTRSYEPQIAYAVTVTVPPPVTVTMPVAVQPVGFPDVTFGCELAIAPLALLPCVMLAPPPSSFCPPVHVAVLTGVDIPTAGLPPVAAALPCTT